MTTVADVYCALQVPGTLTYFVRNPVSCVEATATKRLLSSHLCIFHFTNNNVTSEKSGPPGGGSQTDNEFPNCCF